MEKPVARDRSPSPRRGGGASTTTPGGTTTKPATQLHCFNFLKGKCTKGDDCNFAHVSQEVVDASKKAQAKAKAKAKGKAQPKAEAIASKPATQDE